MKPAININTDQKVLAKNFAKFLEQQHKQQPKAYDPKTYDHLMDILNNNDGFCDAINMVWMYGMKLQDQKPIPWLSAEGKKKIFVLNKDTKPPTQPDPDTILIQEQQQGNFAAYWLDNEIPANLISRYIEAEAIPPNTKELLHKPGPKEEEEVKKLIELTPFRDDNNWFKNTVDLIATYDKKKTLTSQQQSDITRLLSLIAHFQRYYEFEDSAQISNDPYETSDYNALMADSRNMAPKKTFELHFPNVTQKQLENLLMIPDLLPNNQMIRLSGGSSTAPGHGIGIFKKEELYYYFDPNNKQGAIEAKTPAKLAELICAGFCCTLPGLLQFIPSKLVMKTGKPKFSIQVAVFSYDTPYTPPPEQQVLDHIATISPDIALINAVHIFKSNINTIERLVEKGANPNILDNTRLIYESALLTLMMRDKTDENQAIIAALLKSSKLKDGINIGNRYGNTALMCAFLKPELYLINSGNDLEGEIIKFTKSKTANNMFIAAYDKDKNLLSCAGVSNGVVGAITSTELNPNDAAIFINKLEAFYKYDTSIIETLIKNNADPYIINNSGQSVFSLLLTSNKTNEEKAAIVNILSKGEYTDANNLNNAILACLLNNAVLINHTKLNVIRSLVENVKLCMLDNTTNPYLPNKTGGVSNIYLALKLNATNKSSESEAIIVELLKNQKLNREHINTTIVQDGNTALIYAIKNNCNPAVIRELMENGANPYLINTKTKTSAFMLALTLSSNNASKTIFNTLLQNNNRTVQLQYGTYVGNVVSGKKRGIGTMTFTQDYPPFKSGDKYEGQWQDNKFCGQGKMTYANGDVYVGEWKNNQRSGHGKITRADKTTYVGLWKKDAQDGHGIMTYANGDEYVGEWKNNNQHGHGKMTEKVNNKITYEYEGEWIDNCWAEDRTNPFVPK